MRSFSHQDSWDNLGSSGPTVRARVSAADKSTQFPNAVEDVLGGQRQKGLFARRKTCKDPILTRLHELQASIKKARSSIETAEAWLSLQGQTREHRAKWKETVKRESHRLRHLEDQFWELNCPDESERARLRLAEYFDYQRQKEHRNPEIRAKLVAGVPNSTGAFDRRSSSSGPAEFSHSSPGLQVRT